MQVMSHKAWSESGADVTLLYSVEDSAVLNIYRQGHTFLACGTKSLVYHKLHGQIPLIQVYTPVPNYIHAI